MPSRPLRRRAILGSLDLIVFLVACLAAAAVLLAAPAGASERIRRGEQEATAVLLSIAAAQDALTAEAESRPEETFGFMPQILPALPGPVRASFVRPLSELADAGAPQAGVYVHGGYCFILYLADRLGQPALEPQPGGVKPGFWIAYAWPLEYGVTGRRLFVLDSAGVLRYWDNDLGRYSGAGVAPSAALGRGADAKDHPLAHDVVGWERSLRWKVHAPVVKDE
jgi:hypothetical protein